MIKSDIPSIGSLFETLRGNVSLSNFKIRTADIIICFEFRPSSAVKYNFKGIMYGKLMCLHVMFYTLLFSVKDEEWR